jgi:hypothetical protein
VLNGRGLGYFKLELKKRAQSHIFRTMFKIFMLDADDDDDLSDRGYIYCAKLQKHLRV